MTPHFDRLTKLVEMLDTIPDRKFNISHWIDKRRALGFIPCGTTACAIGWAAEKELFEGLTMSEKFGTIEYEFTNEMGYHSLVGFVAVAQLFNIDEDVARYFFSGAFYKVTGLGPGGFEYEATPKMVANRIRNWMAEQKRMITVEQIKQDALASDSQIDTIIEDFEHDLREIVLHIS